MHFSVEFSVCEYVCVYVHSINAHFMLCASRVAVAAALSKIRNTLRIMSAPFDSQTVCFINKHTNIMQLLLLSVQFVQPIWHDGCRGTWRPVAEQSAPHKLVIELKCEECSKLHSTAESAWRTRHT